MVAAIINRWTEEMGLEGVAKEKALNYGVMLSDNFEIPPDTTKTLVEGYGDGYAQALKDMKR